MLILPAEQQLNWKHPPIATLLLIIINCAVFFGYQSKDYSTVAQMFSLYEKNNLLKYEAEPYLSYVEKRDKHQYVELRQLYKDSPNALIPHIIQDVPFGEQTNKLIDQAEEEQTDNSDVIEEELYTEEPAQPAEVNNIAEDGETDETPFMESAPPKEEILSEEDRRIMAEIKNELKGKKTEKTSYVTWRLTREKINTLQQNLSYFKYGLIPAKIKPIDFITSQFLHGSFMHLLGNMIFLFIIGFSIEIAIGRTMYILFYLLSGMAGGVFFCILNLGSELPMVGASGAISGLMGMYLAIYGTRKISFFYWIAFYFNYFKASALLMLPIWIGKEIYEALTGDNQVAYSAHVGGMLVGFISLYAAKGKVVTLNEEYVEKIDLENVYNQKLVHLNRLIVELKFDQAKKYCEELLSEKPKDLSVISHYYHLCKLNPDSPEFKEVANHIFALNSRDNLALVHEIYLDYIGRNAPTLSNKINISLVKKFSAIDMLSDAETILKKAMQQANDPDLPEAILLYAGKIAKVGGEMSKVKTLTTFLQEHFPDAVETKQIMTLNR